MNSIDTRQQKPSDANEPVLLNTITELSHEFGTLDYVKGGGGNSSCKQANTVWVKPSGCTLSGLAATSFVAMDRKQLARLYEIAPPADATAREAMVKDLMLAAVKPGQAARPSVEAPLHDLLRGSFVVHTHPTLVNGLTCARQGATACAELFPDALWIPYVDPGYTLCMEVRHRYQGQAVVLLENHGIFVTGDSPNEIREHYRRIIDTLRGEYDRAGIPTTLTTPPPNEPGPITPDHIVYGLSPNRKNSDLARQMAADCALIEQLAKAFGGAKLLEERSRKFIETWEVESYRQQQLSR